MYTAPLESVSEAVPKLHSPAKRLECVFMKPHAAFVLAFLLVILTALTRAVDCKQTTYGKCHSLHGRYNIYADGDALWPIGTNRLLETTDDRLDQMLEKAGWQEHSIVGDFVVCPTSPYVLGHKQSVCIHSYKNLKLAPWK